MELKSRCPQWGCCGRGRVGGGMNEPQMDVAKTQGKLKRDQVSKDSPTDPDHNENRCTTAPAIDINSRCIQGTQCKEKQRASPQKQTEGPLSQWHLGHRELLKSRCHLGKYRRREITGGGVGLLID